YLQGGDEITLSISPAFRELGMEHEFVQWLLDHNTRVAVTVAHGGAEGHREAMKTAYPGHKELKKFEEIGRALDNERDAHVYTPEQVREAKQLTEEIKRMYTATDDKGGTRLEGMRRDSKEILWDAARLLTRSTNGSRPGVDGKAIVKAIVGAIDDDR
ncbi:MAG TPA: hypothetical protein VGC41_29430, partial [Kofleriaceae bacterium]